MIGERLKEVRKAHNDKQADLAEKLEVSVFTVQSWEQEKSEPSHTKLKSICLLYKVSSDYLLGLTNTVSNSLVAEWKNNLSKSDWQTLTDLACFLNSRQKTK